MLWATFKWTTCISKHFKFRVCCALHKQFRNANVMGHNFWHFMMHFCKFGSQRQTKSVFKTAPSFTQSLFTTVKCLLNGELYGEWLNEISDTTQKLFKHHCISRYSCDTSGRAQHHVNKPSTQEGGAEMYWGCADVAW